MCMLDLLGQRSGFIFTITRLVLEEKYTPVHVVPTMCDQFISFFSITRQNSCSFKYFSFKVIAFVSETL